MNKTIRYLLVLSATVTLQASALLADDATRGERPPVRNGRIITYRRVPVNESLPQLGARLYDQLDLEQKLRKLDVEIRLTKAHLEAQRERTEAYDKHFGRTPALFLTRQDAHLAVLESELRLKELRKQKQLLRRHRQDMVRYRQLALEQGGVEVRVTE